MALTSDQINVLRDSAYAIAQPITEFILKDVARRVAKAGKITDTAAYQIYRAQALGESRKAIKDMLRKQLGITHSEINRLFHDAAKKSYGFDTRGIPWAQPFEQNGSLQQIVSAAAALAKKDFTNLTQTLGLTAPDGKPYPLQKAYQKCMDGAFEQVFTGVSDYNTAIRQATHALADKGVRFIDYESGVSTSLEAAVRRNIMGGLGLMDEQIVQADHDMLGCNGWEISAHANSAPDHEDIQGRQYSDADFARLNASLARRIGTLNCGHTAFPIILGVHSPQYTPEQLRRFRDENARGITYQGRHYTGYEATQKQRALETAIRAQKRRCLVQDAAGDEEKLLLSRVKLGRLREEYARFSNAAGLPMQNERAQVAGFGRSQAAAARKTVEKYSAVKYNKNGTIVVTDDWKTKGKVSMPKKYIPNAVVETQTVYKNGRVQIDRTLYDEKGVIKTQVHSGPHNRPDLHRMGRFGEHAHDYVWNEDGTRKDRIDRDLNEFEIKAHSDLLKGGGNHG